MNSFRSSVLSGKGPRPSAPLLGEKKARGGAPADALDKIAVSREVARTADHRDEDRHRLLGESAEVRFQGATRSVELINLSGGGAMIRADFAPNLWERVDLKLGENGTIECAVRWIRGDRIGLEFAHETQVDGDPAQRDAMMLEVLRRSFPEIDVAPRAADEIVSPEPVFEGKARRAEPRHPLIWSGHILHNHESTPVRLRNISPTGALVESPVDFASGAEIYLDLGEAGSLFAEVSWVRGDQLGLRFVERFDISDLAKARPTLAPRRWSSPEYLRDGQADTSPWADPWQRLSIEEMKSSLEGFLKH